MAAVDPASIRLLVMDVDGVLTDGGIHINDHGVETKQFHVRDGTGIRVWLKLGNEAAIITGRSGMAVRHRASELGVRHVIQGSGDKAADLRGLLRDLKLNPGQAAMIGDDLPDLTAMKMVGYPIAVADAVDEIRSVAAFTTAAAGGRGAVRQAIEHLLKSADRWRDVLQHFESPPRG